jgi:hypothetical protein
MEIKLLKNLLCVTVTTNFTTVKNYEKKRTAAAGQQLQGMMEMWPKFAKL